MENQKKKHRIINGTKGAISLFLAVLMTPFLTIAMLLVEVGRYNSAVSILDEAMGTSAISLLANYDTYLHDRWGLLAITQAKDTKALYNDYMKNNIGVMGGALSLDSVTMNGAMALSDQSVLKEQIIEYCKLNAPVTLASNFLNISSLLNIFEGLNNIDKYMKVLTTGANIATDMVDLAENIDELKKSANKLDEYSGKYESTYNSFKTSVNDLIDSLSTLEDLKEEKATKEAELAVLKAELQTLLAQESSNSDSESEEDSGESQAVTNKRAQIAAKEQEIRELNSDIADEEKTIGNMRSTATTKRDEYATLLGDISSEMNNYVSLMGNVDSAISSLQSDVLSGVGQVVDLAGEIKTKQDNLKTEKEKLKTMDPTSKEYAEQLSKINTLDREITDLQIEKEVFNTTKEGVTTMTGEWDSSSDGYNEALLKQSAAAFAALKTKVSNVNISGLTSSSSKITDAEYKDSSIAGYMGAEALQTFLDEQEKKLKEGTLSGILKGLTAVYEKIWGLDVIFENDLDAYIDEAYYADNFGSLPGGSAAANKVIVFFENLADTLEAITKLQKDFATLKWKELWKDIKDIFEKGKKAFTSLIDAISEPFLKIASVFTEGYVPFYLTTYGAYMTSCRTDFSDVSGAPSFSNMSGYSVPTSAFPTDKYNVELGAIESITAIINQFTKATGNSKKDLTFKGAELEYMLAGTYSEVGNQALTFLELYLLRVLCCLPAISANTEVLAIAGSTTIGAPAVMVFYYLIEPLVQTVLLCNGSSIEFIPTKLFLTPSGLPGLLTELCSLCKMSDADKKALEKDMLGAFGSDKDKYEKAKADLESTKKEESTSKPQTQSQLDKRVESYKQGLLKFNYREYCFLLMLVFVKNETIVARLSNLIQMESHYYYKQQQASSSGGSGEYSFAFDLHKSYTFVDATADVKVEQILPSLTDSSLFDLTRENYRGY